MESTSTTKPSAWLIAANALVATEVGGVAFLIARDVFDRWMAYHVTDMNGLAWLGACAGILAVIVLATIAARRGANALLAVFCLLVGAVSLLMLIARFGDDGRRLELLRAAVGAHLLITAALNGRRYQSLTAIRRAVPSPLSCRQCGYDLRATPGRCPECGTPTDAHRSYPT